jgi:glycosyltransferase involved in cell wall biosynthesis
LAILGAGRGKSLEGSAGQSASTDGTGAVGCADPPWVGVLSMHPAPYRDPTYAEVSRRGRIRLQVLTLSESDGGHPFWDLEKPNYPNTFLGRGYRIGRGQCIHPGLIRLLHDFHFDAVVISSLSATMRLAMLFCWLNGVPYVYSSDGVFNERLHPVGRIVRSFRDRLVASRAGAVFVPGRAARVYVESLGVPAARVFEGCYQLDTNRIHNAVEETRMWRDRLRAELGIGQSCFVFLMVANMIPARHHQFLLNAFHVVRAHSDSYLVLIGEGPERQSLEEICQTSHYENVRIAGGVSYKDLPEWYAACDAYVHSGYEPYSTAVAYAATAGLPIVSSNAVGAAQDYVVDGVTGYLCDPLDVDALAENMLRLAQDPNLAKRMGQQAQKMALARNTTWAAEQLEQAVMTAISSRWRPL